jgi:predicted amidohydrolase YtcJ
MLNATLVVVNANVITLNARQPKAEALAIRDGKIVALGSNEEIHKYIDKKTRLIDAKNKTVVPGFVDCHVHMTGFGHSLQTLQLRNAASIREVQRRIREFVKKNPDKEWVSGGRWDQERFSQRRYPTRWDLDHAVADKPVFLMRVCGHIGVANSRALQLAGITRRTVVDGGRIDLNEETGEPNGILRENALELVWKVIPKPTLKELEEACLLACKKAVEAGLTCVHWILGSANEVRAIQKLASENRLPVRVYLGIPIELLDELVKLGLATGFGNDMVKIGFVKILADGSLGGHTAALKKPYNDQPETQGMMLYTQHELESLILKAHTAGLQVAIHAIGDHTMEVVLKAYEKILGKSVWKGHRHRIEHCSVLSLSIIKRMKRLGLIASVQPHFVISDFWVIDRLGKIRARWTYPFKTLVEEGLVVVSGSDCPVEPVDPILGIWATVARKSFPEERLTIEDALKTYTANAAYASFDEDKRGTIEAGKYGDLTILSEDPFRVSVEEIRKIDVDMTIVDGKIVHARKPS